MPVGHPLFYDLSLKTNFPDVTRPFSPITPLQFRGYLHHQHNNPPDKPLRIEVHHETPYTLYTYQKLYNKTRQKLQPDFPLHLVLFHHQNQ